MLFIHHIDEQTILDSVFSIVKAAYDIEDLGIAYSNEHSSNTSDEPATIKC